MINLFIFLCGVIFLFVALFRTFILFSVITIVMRVMGKRQLGQLQPFDLVITLLISELAAVAIQDISIPLYFSLVPIVVLLILEIGFSVTALKSITFRKIIEGKPVIVINKGVVDQREMRRLRMTVHDLTEQLRISGAFDIDDVYYAIVETNGKMSVLKKKEQLPPVSQDMNLSPRDTALPLIIICDGKLQKDSLKLCNLNEKALHNILEKDDVRLSDVFILQADGEGKYHLIKKEAGS